MKNKISDLFKVKLLTVRSDSSKKRKRDRERERELDKKYHGLELIYRLILMGIRPVIKNCLNETKSY